MPQPAGVRQAFAHSGGRHATQRCCQCFALLTQCQLLTFLPSSRDSTIQRGSPSPHLAMAADQSSTDRRCRCLLGAARRQCAAHVQWQTTAPRRCRAGAGRGRGGSGAVSRRRAESLGALRPQRSRSSIGWMWNAQLALRAMEEAQGRSFRPTWSQWGQCLFRRSRPISCRSSPASSPHPSPRPTAGFLLAKRPLTHTCGIGCDTHSSQTPQVGRRHLWRLPPACGPLLLAPVCLEGSCSCSRIHVVICKQQTASSQTPHCPPPPLPPLAGSSRPWRTTASRSRR